VEPVLGVVSRIRIQNKTTFVRLDGTMVVWLGVQDLCAELRHLFIAAREEEVEGGGVHLMWS
jgi:hypothetical protein